MKRLLLASVGAILFLSGCASLPPEKMTELRSCKTSLEQVRRNLLKKGFGLKADEKDFINTDLHTADFGFKEMAPMAFTVEKTSAQSVKFITRGLIEGREKEFRMTAINEKHHREIKDVLCAK